MRALTTRQSGFTMVEMIIVLVLAAILSTLSFGILRGPLESYAQTRSVSRLTQTLGKLHVQLSRDVANALPNSVRVRNGHLELLRITAMARYRDEGPGGKPHRLAIGSNDDEFNTLQVLGELGTSVGEYLAIIPAGLPAADPYAEPVMTPTLAALTISTTKPPGPPKLAQEARVSFSPAHRFPADSPDKTVFRVQGAVSYDCANGQLREISNYPLSSVQSEMPEAHPDAVVRVLATGLSQCEFRMIPLSVVAGEMLLSELTLSERGLSVTSAMQIRAGFAR